MPLPALPCAASLLCVSLERHIIGCLLCPLLRSWRFSGSRQFTRTSLKSSAACSATCAPPPSPVFKPPAPFPSWKAPQHFYTHRLYFRSFTLASGMHQALDGVLAREQPCCAPGHRSRHKPVYGNLWEPFSDSTGGASSRTLLRLRAQQFQSFLCCAQTCRKQYKTAMEMETHLSSYDHHHTKARHRCHHRACRQKDSNTNSDCPECFLLRSAVALEI